MSRHHTRAQPIAIPIFCAFVLIAYTSQVLSQSLQPRWGHSAVYISSPPTLLIQGGKTDPSAGNTYSSSPNSPDTIFIPLEGPFPGASPPFVIASPDLSPQNAFHTLSVLEGDGSACTVLAFGGDGGQGEATQTQANSAWQGLVDVENSTVAWAHQASGWANQPQRRLYHSAAGPGQDGRVYLTGGLKGDGSGVIFTDVWAYDPHTGRFESVSPLPNGLYHHTSVLLPNNTLVVLAGLSTSQTTGNAVAIPLSTIYTLDTSDPASTWEEKTMVGSPLGRRGARLVLNDEGTGAFLFGGGDVALTEAYGDGWVLDFGTLTWTQVSDGSQGPTPRFDHAAVNVGGQQIVVFGGYGRDGPADVDMHFWDMGAEAWAPSFVPLSKDTAGSSPTPASDHPVQSTPGGIPGKTSVDEPHKTLSDANGHDSTHGSTGSSTVPSASSASSSQKPGALSTGAKIVLVLGILAIVVTAIAGLLYRYRRRKRRTALFGGAQWEQRGSDHRRPHDRGEKGSGRGLLDDAEEAAPQEPEKAQSRRFDLGGIGVGLASARGKFSRRSSYDPYTVLPDGGQNQSGPKRQSTRRIGTGIRLVGPRSSPSSRSTIASSSNQPDSDRQSLGALQPPRPHMLHDEDSRFFVPEKETEEWAVSRAAKHGRWMSASSILGEEEEEEDPFGDYANEGLAPPMRGGPVPTPRDSRSELDPFDDYTRRSSTLLSTYDDLLSPPLEGYSEGSSLPRSQRSGNTLSTSDTEEGVVHHAHLLSHTSAAIITPARTDAVPLKRSESFFKRMTQGGLSSILSRQQSQRSTEWTLDIRDPNPAPSLWPIDGQDNGTLTSNDPRRGYPPSAFTAGVEPPKSARLKGPSLSSLQSARSMRDMIIVQREPTTSSDGGFVVEIGTSTEQTEAEMGHETVDHVRVESPLDMGAPGAPGLLREDGPPRTAKALAQRGAPGLIDLGAKHSPSRPVALPPSPIGPFSLSSVAERSKHVSTPPKLRAIPQKEVVASASLSVSPLATPGKESSEPPSGSPVPSPVVSHRRPVRDVVNSINKRGGGVPLVLPSLSSKSSSVVITGSPTFGIPPARPATMYEAVKREPLVVANPDKRRELNRSNSD